MDSRKIKKIFLLLSLVLILAAVCFLALEWFYPSSENPSGLSGGDLLGAQDSSGSAAQNSVQSPNINAILRMIKKITLNLSILKDWKFSNLIKYGRSPSVEEKGRTNPFQPY